MVDPDRSFYRWLWDISLDSFLRFQSQVIYSDSWTETNLTIKRSCLKENKLLEDLLPNVKSLKKNKMINRKKKLKKKTIKKKFPSKATICTSSFSFLQPLLLPFTTKATKQSWESARHNSLDLKEKYRLPTLLKCRKKKLNTFLPAAIGCCKI